MVYLLDDKDIWFPHPRNGEPEDGFFAVGGDLSPERLLLAYSFGAFPWYAFKKEDNVLAQKELLNEDGTPKPRWYCPMKRFVIFPSEIHISHSMRQLLHKGVHKVTFNHAFDKVIRHCSESRIEMQGAWLGPQIIEAYTRLHNMGYAKSVEVWDADNQLVGGLYGITLGKNFFGESMFSLTPSASKLALIALAQSMPQDGTALIDCQFETAHLKSMGGRHITYDEYMNVLA